MAAICAAHVEETFAQAEPVPLPDGTGDDDGDTDGDKDEVKDRDEDGDEDG